MENIMITQSKQEDGQQELDVTLIDYGMVTKYLDDDQIHLPNDVMEHFKGNLIFAGSSVLEFNRPSRKDDLIMVCYLMIYLLNGAEMPLLFDYLEN